MGVSVPGARAVYHGLIRPHRIEHLTKFKKKQAAFIKSGKDGAEEAVQKVVQKAPAPGNQNWKREILEGRKKKRDDLGPHGGHKSGP